MTMNGAALEREFGGLSANDIFKKEGWLVSTQPTIVTDKKNPTRTTELMEKWKSNATKKAHKREDKDETSAEVQPNTSHHVTKKPRRLDSDNETTEN